MKNIISNELSLNKKKKSKLGANLKDLGCVYFLDSFCSYSLLDLYICLVKTMVEVYV